MAVDTRTVTGRRELKYASLAELSADLDALERAHAEGRLDALGGWSPGQVFQHCSILMRCAVDGFPVDAPWIVRVIITALFKKKALSGAPLPPGTKIPNQASFLRPDDDVSFETGLTLLRDVLDRVEAGERFTHPSPIFGRLTHEEWTTLQLGHCSMHLSFLKPREG